MNNGKRFAQLFKGHPARYGRYDITGETVAEEKVAGRARTVDQAITERDYSDHVEGKVGIGVIPLQGKAKKPGRVNFAAIDIDVYKQADQAKRNLTHKDVALTLMQTPLIVTQSKSGGIHVWLFSKEGVSAKLATDYLNAQAAYLGVAGCEVFPKQTERFSEEDVGNWINLPYFGGTRKAVVPSKEGAVIDYIEPDLEQFLDIAEQASEAVTDAWLVDNTTLPSSQRDDDQEEELFYDGPPCLQRLIIGDPKRVAQLEAAFRRKKRDAKFESEAAEKRAEAWLNKQISALRPQNIENNRNNAFFGVSMYLHRRLSPHDPDARLEGESAAKLGELLDGIHLKWCQDTGNSGILSEIPTLKRQGVQGKWGYACTKEPLKSYCDRRLCYKRKHGIGTGAKDSPFSISGFTIVESEERQYYMTVGDKRVHIPDAQALLSQSLFAQHVLNQVDRVWRPLQDSKYKETMDALLEKADRIAPPPESDSISILTSCLFEFVHDNQIAKGQNDMAFFQGRVIWDQDELTAIFKLDKFMDFLRSRGHTQFTAKMVAKRLVQDMGVIGRGNTEVGGRQVRPYEVNLANLLQRVEGDDGED